MVNSLRPDGLGSRGATRGAAPGAAAPPREGPRADPHKVFARIVDEATQQPISGARYEVVDAQGQVVAQGTSDWQGTVRHDVPQGGQYTIRVIEVPPPPAPAPAGGDAPAPAPAPAPEE